MLGITLAVVGSDYPNKRGPGRRFEIALCAPGERVELRPEPKNSADERAIAIYSMRGVQVGYLTAERAPLIGTMIRNGRSIDSIFQAASSFGAYIRCAFDGEPAVLPKSNSEIRRLNDGAFYPDETYDAN
jgi:hypothetical protein